MAAAQKVAERAKPKEKSRGSDSSADELEGDSSTDGETIQLAKKSAKKKVINHFTFFMYIGPGLDALAVVPAEIPRVIPSR